MKTKLMCLCKDAPDGGLCEKCKKEVKNKNKPLNLKKKLGILFTILSFTSIFVAGWYMIILSDSYGSLGWGMLSFLFMMLSLIMEVGK